MYLRLMRFRSSQLISSVSASASCVPDDSIASGKLAAAIGVLFVLPCWSPAQTCS